MKRAILTSLISVFILSSFLYADDPKYDVNTVYMDKVTARPGDHFAVNIYIFNVDTLSGCQVPIFFRSDDIKLWCDSISFEGSRMSHFMFNDVKLPQTEEDDQVAYFSFIATIDPDVYIDPLSPGDGLLATLYFTAPEDCPEGAVHLKRGMIPHPQISFIFAVWNPNGDEQEGELIESEITIKKK